MIGAIKKYAGAIALFLGMLAIGIISSLSALKRSREQKRTGDIAKDLAKQNAARAREQAKASAQAIDAQAAKAIAAKDAQSLKESTDAAATGNLADYLNNRKR